MTCLPSATKRGGLQSYRGISSQADRGHSTVYKKVVRLETSVVEVTSFVQCNRCRREVEFTAPDETQEFHEFKVSGSWASKFPEDLVTLKWVWCADCLRYILLQECPIPPEESGYHARTVPIKATHTGTDEKIVIYNGLAFTRDSFLDPHYPTTVDLDLIESHAWPPLAVFRHYKGGLYTTVGSCLMAGTNEPLVLYQELYGESRIWVRPLAEWEAAVSIEGSAEVVRFTRVSLPGQAP